MLSGSSRIQKVRQPKKHSSGAMQCGARVVTLGCLRRSDIPERAGGVELAVKAGYSFPDCALVHQS